MYFITTKRMLEVCFSAHPNIQYRTFVSYDILFTYDWTGLHRHKKGDNTWITNMVTPSGQGKTAPLIQIEQTETRHPVNRWSWRNSRHAPWIQARMTAVMGGASQVPVDMRKMGGTRQAR